jgi:hypothetical protein
MKRVVSVAVMLGLLAGAMVVPAEAKKRKKPKRVSRTVKVPYSAPGFGTATATIGCSPALGSCGNFPIGPKDLFVKVTLTDQTGTPTAFSVGQDTEPGDPTNNIEKNHGTFCGTTGKRPIALVPGAEITVFIWAWGDAACPTGIGTTGIVKAKFSNLP